MDSFLSPRARDALKPALSYGAAFQSLKDLGLWSPGAPDGSIVLGVAENQISSDLIHAKLASLGPFPERLLSYQAWRGIPELGAAIKAMLERTFMKGVEVDVDHITCAAGAGAIIDMLTHCIASAGDGILIPAPYYPAFDNDLSVRNGVSPVPVYLPPAGEDPTAALDAAAAAAAAAGTPIRALLVTNPSNPLGTVAPAAQLRAMMAWCLRRRVHFVSDEIYALSVYRAGGPEFVSAAQIAAAAAAAAAAGSSGGAADDGDADAAALPDAHLADRLVHVIFGASKDFCASGLRLGALYSRNAELNTALVNLSYFALPSAPVQWMFARLFGDAAWLDGFVAENGRRLARSYHALTGALDALPDGARPPYVPATAAMFLWLDLRAGLRAPTWDEEEALWRDLVDQRLLLTPGRACHAREPGFFRVCFAWAPAEALVAAVGRIAAVITARRQALLN